MPPESGWAHAPPKSGWAHTCRLSLAGPMRRPSLDRPTQRPSLDGPTRRPSLAGPTRRPGLAGHAHGAWPRVPPSQAWAAHRARLSHAARSWAWPAGPAIGPRYQPGVAALSWATLLDHRPGWLGLQSRRVASQARVANQRPASHAARSWPGQLGPRSGRLVSQVHVAGRRQAGHAARSPAQLAKPAIGPRCPAGRGDAWLVM